MTVEVICFSDSIHSTSKFINLIQAKLSLCYKIFSHNYALLFDLINDIIEPFFLRITKRRCRSIKY